VIGSLPYIINSSGNYELQSNLTYDGKTNAIEVNADNVVINLNGFSVNGNGVFGVINEKHTNVTIRDGSISGFQGAVTLAGAQCRAINLQLVNNVFGVQAFAKDCTVQDCVIIGTGRNVTGYGIRLSKSASGILVKGNQVSEFYIAILSAAAKSPGCAFIGNYIANSGFGLDLSPNDWYQGNVVTNCKSPFTGGNAVGTENGGD
jgi:hypothetical protein